MEYNGWPSYETWAVYTWLTAEWELTAYWERAAREAKDKHELAERLKHSVTNLNPLLGEANLYVDLLGKALENVDWDSVAKAFIDQGITVPPEDQQLPEGVCDDGGIATPNPRQEAPPE